jgi:hypothetical protein
MSLSRRKCGRWCWVWGIRRQKWTSSPIPHESTVSPQEAFTGLCICSCKDVSRAHSTPDSWLPSPTKRTKWKPFHVNNRELTVFRALCPSLGTAFPFSLIILLRVLTLFSLESIQCLKGQFFGTCRQELLTLACDNETREKNTYLQYQMVKVTKVTHEGKGERFPNPQWMAVGREIILNGYLFDIWINI